MFTTNSVIKDCILLKTDNGFSIEPRLKIDLFLRNEYLYKEGYSYKENTIIGGLWVDENVYYVYFCESTIEIMLLLVWFQDED